MAGGLKWLCSDRLSASTMARSTGDVAAGATVSVADGDARTAYERDFDRLLFSAPVRRMADKTQVFPLDRHDSVRNRLTHSHEVSNLARSIGHDVVRSAPGLLTSDADEAAAIPVMLAAVGLSHDVGNPPFGHQGEKAIGEWFERRSEWVFDRATEHDNSSIASAGAFRDEFLEFEGNAQSLRLLTKLQVSRDGFGLDLTAGTLAASMKYTVGCTGVDRAKASRTAANKKYGFFQSEAATFARVKELTGLIDVRRHPLTWLMEAADDLAYSVLDVEDSIEKGLISYHEVIEYIRRRTDGDPVMLEVLSTMDGARSRVEERAMTEAEETDVYVQILRSAAIASLVRSVGRTFIDNWPAIADYQHVDSLIDIGRGAKLANTLQDLARERAFNDAGVLEVELAGRRAVLDLMSWYWIGISDRESFEDPSSKRRSPFANLMYRRISENYRRVFEKEQPIDEVGQPLPMRYRELRLLTDMVSGMTDGYAMQTHADIKKIHAEHAGH